MGLNNLLASLVILVPEYHGLKCPATIQVTLLVAKWTALNRQQAELAEPVTHRSLSVDLSGLGAIHALKFVLHKGVTLHNPVLKYTHCSLALIENHLLHSPTQHKHEIN